MRNILSLSLLCFLFLNIAKANDKIFRGYERPKNQNEVEALKINYRYSVILVTFDDLSSSCGQLQNMIEDSSLVLKSLNTKLPKSVYREHWVYSWVEGKKPDYMFTDRIGKKNYEEVKDVVLGKQVKAILIDNQENKVVFATSLAGKEESNSDIRSSIKQFVEKVELSINQKSAGSVEEPKLVTLRNTKNQKIDCLIVSSDHTNVYVIKNGKNIAIPLNVLDYDSNELIKGLSD